MAWANEAAEAVGIADSAAWRRVSDGILAGICHDLSGRFTALSGIVYLAHEDGRIDETLIQETQAEFDRFEELIRLLRLLTGDRDRVLEPVTIPELWPVVLALFRRQHELDRIQLRVEGGVGIPPVVAAWTGLTKMILILLTAAARVAQRAGGDGVEIVLGTEGDTVLLAIEAAGGRGAADAVGEKALTSLDPVRRVAEELGGSLKERGPAGPAAPAVRFELRLPAWAGGDRP